MKRTLSLVLAFILVFTALLGMIPTSAAETETGKLKITKANLEFASTVYLLIAVDYTDVYATAEEAMAGVSITVDGERLTPDASVPAPEGSVGFKYKELSAKEMGDELIIEAFAGDSAEADDFVSYSILEYTIKARETKADDDYLMNVIDRLLEFGAAAQEAFLPEGESIATVYDYDLTKNHSIAKLVGAVNPKTGDDKVILEEGRDVSVVADGDEADDYIFYNTSLAVRASTQATSTAALTYAEGSETVFAIPAKNAIMMDSYSGETVYHYGLNGNQTFVTVGEDGSLTAVENPINAFLPGVVEANSRTEAAAALSDITATHHSIIKDGYIYSKGIMGYTVTKDALGSYIKPIVEGGQRVFTLSVTVATDSDSYQAVRDWRLYISGSENIVETSSESVKNNGRLGILTYNSSKANNTNRNTLVTFYNADATATSDRITVKALDRTSAAGTPGAFTTVHMVINLDGDSKDPTNTVGSITYYLDDSTEPVATVKMHASDRFFTHGGMRLYSGGLTNAKSAIYLKNFVVTPGDIVNDYN